MHLGRKDGKVGTCSSVTGIGFKESLKHFFEIINTPLKQMISNDHWLSLM